MSENADGEWLYEGVRIGRATRTVDVHSPEEGIVEFKEGTISFDPINEADVWMWEEEDWIDHFYGPEMEQMAHVPFDRVATIELPRPMTNEETMDRINENEDEWRQHLDNSITSNVTADDLIGDVQ